MRSVRVVCSFAVLSFAALMIALVAAQLAAQTLPVGFKAATAYPSGGYGNSSLAVADVNGDGYPDLIVAHASCHDCSSGEVSVLLGKGDGAFQAAVSYPAGIEAYAVAIADLNDDGKLDVVVANGCQTTPDPNCNNGGGVSVLLGNGDGTFQAPVSYSSGGYGADSVAVADVNGDGHLDIVVVNYCQNSSNCNVDGEVSVLLNKGDGTFQAGASYDSGGTYGQAVAIGDVNGDGYPDLIVANAGPCGHCASGGLSVFLGNGDGTFQPPVFFDSGALTNSTSVAIADVNGDGHPDLIVGAFCLTWPTCNNGGIVSVLLNNGDGTFQTAVTYGSGGDYVYAVAVADVNGDGKPDLVALNQCAIGNSNCGSAIGRVGVLPGNGDGTFQAAVSYSSGGRYPVSIAIADVNADGKPDLLVSNDCTIAACGGNGAIGAVGIFLNDFTATTTTAVTSSLNPSKVHQSVTFTAKVSSISSVPNGAVITFYAGTTKIGTRTTVNGVATLTSSFSNAKTYTIKASYPGDAFHKASSGTVTQVVEKYPTTTTLSSSLNPSNYGQAVTLTATVAPTGPYQPTGTVTFKSGSLILGSGTLNASGVVTLATKKIPVGANSLTATYNGDTSNGRSVSAAITQTVSQASISMVLTSYPNPSTFGTSVKFTAKLTSNGGLPSGQPVTFSYNGATLGTANVNSIGVATFYTTALPRGSDLVTAAYAGTVDYSAASATVTQVVH